jgi:hypothetical protein
LGLRQVSDGFLGCVVAKVHQNAGFVKVLVLF